ncbi:hypothetical protein MPTK1_2g05320 [Marchantia polymorpha subsp. ruderalis]|uniref:Secreted protein n=1 Tax=Marchantia polymorpha TaxID=3197 RepID=A0A2R6X7Z3_MARPO|nr:hypothetical protein MARPO_0031s0186 [Marchantia polymorpha]BBN01173.1 hypothetical protein Mp_2g05320 [Marchantia polymorpha subsp. ruderalis]|eukprot:PTQ42224.1 hypothetical protein MARPO_0031s0186 [Marchantia polymorpha]
MVFLKLICAIALCVNPFIPYSLTRRWFDHEVSSRIAAAILRCNTRKSCSLEIQRCLPSSLIASRSGSKSC